MGGTRITGQGQNQNLPIESTKLVEDWIEISNVPPIFRLVYFADETSQRLNAL
jgi:hypothetical protein